MTRDNELVVLGSYTDEGGDGILTFRLDGSTLTQRDVASERNPSFLDIHPSEPIVIAVNEHTDGEAVSYRVESTSGQLDRISRTKTGDDGPCHVAIDPLGEYAIVSHYAGGSVALLSVDSDGGLDGPLDLQRHQGSGLRPDRQSSAHPHSAWFVTDSVVFVPDLGADRLVVYELDREKECLRLVPDGTLKCRPGSGPRHFAIHPSGSVGYLVNELAATLSILELDTARRPTVTDTLSTLPEGADASETIAADVHVHPSGDYVFVSNRGHDSIATFECQSSPSHLTRTAVTRTTGQYPRNFAIHPSGDRLFVCHTHSNDVMSVDFDPQIGKVRPAGPRTETDSPACLRFL